MRDDKGQEDLAEVPEIICPDPEVIRISAWMYLRTIFLMAWSAFRHPFRTTYIDMTSGKTVHIRPGEEMWE